MAVASAGTSTARPEPTTFETETIFDIHARQLELDYSLVQLDTCLQRAPVEKTVHAARAWLFSLNDLKIKVINLKEKVSGWLSGEQTKAFESIIRKTNILLTHLDYTLGERSDEGAYYITPLVLKDLPHIERRLRATFLEKGSFASVFGTTIGGAPRALKTSNIENPIAFRALLREATHYASLSAHPGLLRTGLFMQSETKVRLVLEKGVKDCYSWLNTVTPSSQKEIKKMLEQVAHALQFLHNLGFVHNDIKPENILQCEDGRWVIIDLGVMFPHGTFFNGGPYDYYAPETKTTGYCFPSRDVFSYGLILFELITNDIFYTKDLQIKVTQGALVESDIAHRISFYQPSSASKEFVRRFPEFSLYKLIDFIRNYNTFFLDILTDLDSYSEENIREAANIISFYAKQLKIKATNSGNISIFVKNLPSDTLHYSFISNLFTKLQKYAKKGTVLSFEILALFLKIPGKQHRSFIHSIKELNVFSACVCVTHLDPEGMAFHLAQHCTQINPAYRPTMEHVLKHPYFGNTELSLEEWSSALPPIEEEE